MFAHLPDLLSPAAELMTLFLGCAMVTTPGAWQRLPPLPETNGGFICAVWDGRIVVLGGTNWVADQKRWLAAVHRYDPATARWETLTPLNRPLAHALVGRGPVGLVVVGGTTGQTPFNGQVRLAAGRVSEACGGLVAPAVLSAGGVVGDEMIVVGGTDDVANMAGFRRDAVAWNLRTGATRTLAPYPGEPMGLAGSVVVGDEVLFFGGAGWDAAGRKVRNLSDAYAYSVGSQRWRRLAPLPFGARALAAVVLDAKRVYLAGGSHNDEPELSDQAVIYHLDEDRYTPAPALPYRAFVGLVELDGYVYCLGGEDRAKHRSDEVHRIAVADLVR